MVLLSPHAYRALSSLVNSLNDREYLMNVRVAGFALAFFLASLRYHGLCALTRGLIASRLCKALRVARVIG
jgi:hypothetical protein